MSSGPMGGENAGGKCNETMKFPARTLPSEKFCAMLYQYECRQNQAGSIFLKRLC